MRKELVSHSARESPGEKEKEKELSPAQFSLSHRSLTSHLGFLFLFFFFLFFFVFFFLFSFLFSFFLFLSFSFLFFSIFFFQSPEKGKSGEKKDEDRKKKKLTHQLVFLFTFLFLLFCFVNFQNLFLFCISIFFVFFLLLFMLKKLFFLLLTSFIFHFYYYQLSKLSSEGATDLTHIIEFGLKSDLNRVLKKDPKIVNKPLDQAGNLPIHLACEFGSVEIVHLLIKFKFVFLYFLSKKDFKKIRFFLF